MAMKSILASTLMAIIGVGSSASAQSPTPLGGVRRIVFVGDSITYSGHYIADVEAYLRLKNPPLACEFLDLGLPSETVSGLSEPGHAGGDFPRPDLKERLDRVLDRLKPDLVVACYGMNDGIYAPFDEDRFLKYQEGLKHLRTRAEAAGSKVLHLTPPVFDPEPIRSRTLPAGLAEYRQPYEGYDVVLDRYSGWLLAQRSAGWDVVDIHGPMTMFLKQARDRDPTFRLAGDGVHIDSTGHWIIARQILLHWGIPERELPESSTHDATFQAFPNGTEILAKIGLKQAVLRDSWLNATGHKRPGMSVGLATAQAKEKADAVEVEVHKLLNP